jgi:hypothetical protein
MCGTNTSGGQPLSEGKGMQEIQRQDESTTVHVGSGHYRFTLQEEQ